MKILESSQTLLNTFAVFGEIEEMPTPRTYSTLSDPATTELFE